MLVWLESFILFGSGLKHSSRFVYITFKIDLVNIQPCFVYIRLNYPQIWVQYWYRSSLGDIVRNPFIAMRGGKRIGRRLRFYIPPFFEKSGRVSTVSGVINSCTYIGSAVSTYGIALLSEKMGWNFTTFVWFLIAISGTLICFVCKGFWQKRFSI